jgi:hypothetical protein
MDQTTIMMRADEIRQLLAERLGVRGRDLAQAVARAGRRLPRAVRTDARYLAETEALARNPRLVRMVDPQHFARASDNLTRHLTAIDPRQRRRTALINLAAVIAFNLLVVAILVLIVLVWRGIV